MRNALIASALCGFAAAAPQMINIEAALNVPVPTILGPAVEETAAPSVSYNPVVAASSAAAAVATGGVETKKVKRDACAVQPGGAGPVPGAGSVEDYTGVDSELRATAEAAGTPSGYAKSFTNKLGSTQQIGYLTYKNIESGEYDVDACAAFCDSEKYCLGFNIFYECDPSQEPGAGCENPAPITNVKCSIYGYPVAEASATNDGQWRAGFQVVITGSNGYSKLDRDLPSVPEFNAPTTLPATINAPLAEKDGQPYDTYNGMRLFNSNPYDPSLCAAACQAQTEFDKEHLVDANGEYKPCNFFTSYILTKNGVPLGTYCALYTQSWGPEYAVNTGYFYGDDVYSVVKAGSYFATNPDSGKVATVDADAN